MRTKLVFILIGLACIGAGYSIRIWQQMVYEDLPLAESTYHDFRTDGRTLGRNQLDAWRKHLKGRLQEDLRLPQKKDYECDYGEWGRAFYVMNNDGRHFSLRFEEGMDSARQDELIRYLCFVIENEATRNQFLEFEHISGVMAPVKPYEAFDFLLQYPREALNRNSGLISRVIRQAVNGQDHFLHLHSLAFIASQIDEDWAAKLCVDYLDRMKTGEYDGLPYEILLGDLHRQSTGGANLIALANPNSPRPSERVKAASLNLLNKYEGRFGRCGVVDRTWGFHIIFPEAAVCHDKPSSQPDRKP